MAYRIKSIEDKEVQDVTVYNFDVEGDHSYSVYGYISHNCRIANETCSICNSQNEFIHERCEHLRDNMNEILPDGRRVYAKNFGMRFFDISDVGVPADPAAYSLAKVASHTAAPTAPNKAFDADGYSEWRSKHSEMTKLVPADGTLEAVYADGTLPDNLKKTPLKPKEYTQEELKSALYAANNDLSTVLSTAAAASIVFSPHELCTLTALAEPDKVASHSFSGFQAITFDKVSPLVYHSLRCKFAARSGFVAPIFATGWEPAKLASEGYEVVADYYAFYRDALRSLSHQTFTKAAHRIPYLREVVDAGGSVKAATANLAFCGMCP